MVQPTITLEMALGTPIRDVAGNVIADVAGDPILDMGLVDKFSEVRGVEGITLEQGIPGNGPQDRVAEPGELGFYLKNENGLYTPDGGAVLERFANGLAVKLGMSYGGNVDNSRARIRFIHPDSGSYGRQATEVRAYDYMLELAKAHTSQIAVQLNRRDDQLIQTLLNNLPNIPIATSFALGPDTYPYAFQNLADEDAKGLGVLQAIAQSGLGYIFMVSDTTYGETLKYQSRISRLENDTPVASLSDTMEGVNVSRDETKRARKVTVYVNPVRVDEAATTVLWSSNNEMVLNPGQTKFFVAYYRDPNNENVRLAGVNVQEMGEAAGTDFKFSSTPGSGEDLNASLSVTMIKGGNSSLVYVTNNAAETGYLWYRQIRGKGIYLYERESRFAENTDLLVGQELEFLLPYNPSLDQAQDFADILLQWWGDDISTVDGVVFDAAKNETLLNAMLNGKIGSLVSLSESKSNLSGNFYINHRKVGPFDGVGRIPVEWAVVPAQFASFCILDSATNAQLDSTAILAV